MLLLVWVYVYFSIATTYHHFDLFQSWIKLSIETNSKYFSFLFISFRFPKIYSPFSPSYSICVQINTVRLFLWVYFHFSISESILIWFSFRLVHSFIIRKRENYVCPFVLLRVQCTTSSSSSTACSWWKLPMMDWKFTTADRGVRYLQNRLFPVCATLAAKGF